MKLNDSIIKAAKPKEKNYSIADGHRLTLQVKSTGGKWWRCYCYRFNGTPEMLSLGDLCKITRSSCFNAILGLFVSFQDIFSYFSVVSWE